MTQKQSGDRFFLRSGMLTSNIALFIAAIVDFAESSRLIAISLPFQNESRCFFFFLPTRTIDLDSREISLVDFSIDDRANR